MALRVERLSDHIGFKGYLDFVVLDPRTADFPLLRSPLLLTTLLGSYIYFCYVLGPKLMANRKPYDLRNVIRIYNLFMVFANVFFLWIFLKNSFFSGYSLFCQGMTFSTDQASLNILHYGWYYLWIRTLDFLDTIFFVLRKKYEHITFQHVSHHTLVVFNGYVFLSLGCDGQSIFGLCINCAIHIAMYIYYFLAACGPQYRKYLWWKKYLTKAQIYQHVIIMIHGIIPLFYDCNFPRWYILVCFPQGILGLALFINFYEIAYGKADKSGKPRDFFNHNVCVLNDFNNDVDNPLKKDTKCD